MKLVISNIEWDYEGRSCGRPVPEGLPDTVAITDGDIINSLMMGSGIDDESVMDYLRDTYRYYLISFETSMEGMEG